jgi:glycine/serine hydroxymethyltransferase
MKEKEAERVAQIMVERLQSMDDSAKETALKNEVEKLCLEFPVPEVFV